MLNSTRTVVRKLAARMASIYQRQYVDPSSQKIVDLRSDTLTQPSTEMRKAMAEAVVGDDIFEEDPTMKELERRCADMFGMEAALFVPSGTMGNLISCMTHCPRRGSELIVGIKQHIHKYEQGGYAQLAGISSTNLPNNDDGTISMELIEQAIRDYTDIHQAKTELICLENTHNMCGGRVLSMDYQKKVRALADRHGLKVHVDGARIVNAAVALGLPLSSVLQYADSVCMCFSKGIGAPIGSAIGGTQKFITEARRSRKALGGGMRQSGVLAAAALVGLDEAEKVATQDNRNARRLAEEDLSDDDIEEAISKISIAVKNL